jgi:hypothetical protein
VTLIATNACGQSDTLIQELTVLGLEDLSAMGITAYPNPTSGLVTLSGLANYISEEFSIIDLQGRIVEIVRIESDAQVIDIKHAANGLYLIRIHNGVLPLRLQR